jgi:HPt (histidine-containing phosphotransfer) domain-containing protein
LHGRGITPHHPPLRIGILKVNPPSAHCGGLERSIPETAMNMRVPASYPISTGGLAGCRKAAVRARHVTRLLLVLSAALLVAQSLFIARQVDVDTVMPALLVLTCATALLLATLFQFHDLRKAAAVLENAAHPAADATRQGNVWDEERLGELFAAVGAEGLRDLLRLFHADVPAAMAELSRAIDARDAGTLDSTLHALEGAAANLGLASVAALADSLRQAGIERSIPDRLAAEIARAGIIPDIKKAA